MSSEIRRSVISNNAVAGSAGCIFQKKYGESNQMVGVKNLIQLDFLKNHRKSKHVLGRACKTAWVLELYI